MKIICEVHELAALQRNEEVQQGKARIIYLESEVERLHDAIYKANHRADSFEERLGTAASELTSMCLISQAFREINNDSPNKIKAIKLIREALSCGLREAKNIVEGNPPNYNSIY